MSGEDDFCDTCKYGELEAKEDPCCDCIYGNDGDVIFTNQYESRGSDHE